MRKLTIWLFKIHYHQSENLDKIVIELVSFTNFTKRGLNWLLLTRATTLLWPHKEIELFLFEML